DGVRYAQIQIFARTFHAHEANEF
ncbi:MAG: hypothetical protein QOK03_2865, partial [Candidatus Binataceae bacterium]|nr:hypothetical protein [Candidatus Binataceae bacterium]